MNITDLAVGFKEDIGLGGEPTPSNRVVVIKGVIRKLISKSNDLF
jgi:hypothetical protein